MSLARGFGPNGQALYSNVVKPSEINLQFTVAATNGLGITSLKSNGYVRNVFMHTSTTPSSNDGYLNPNPISGYALIQLKQNLNHYLSHYASIKPPLSGSDVKIDNSAMTAGQAYVISTLGNASAAKWLAIGVPPGVTPAVGVSFIALSNGGAGNTLTSRVQVPLVSGVSQIEVVGSPDLSVSANISSNGGEWLMMQFLGVSGSVAAPVFTGSALAAHQHNLIVIGGQAASTTNDVAVYTDVLGKEQAADATILGVDSATKGGVVGASAGTPAGSIAAPAFTGAMALVAPAAGSIVSMRLYFDGSAVTVDGI